MASRVLGYLGIHNDVLIVKFNGGKLAHAICIWKDKEGNLCFISDKKLFRTGEKTIKNAIEKYYPDWEDIISTNEKGRYLGTVVRKN
ncbi:MAG: hypothetical protein WBB86_04935 [Candidatus Omnitrophota bacterium]